MDALISAGLVFGAIFQLICIAAVIWVPSAEPDHRDSGDTNSSDDDMSVGSGGSSSSFTRGFLSRNSQRRVRHERKKRR